MATAKPISDIVRDYYRNNPLAQIAREFPIYLDQLPEKKLIIVSTRAPKPGASGGLILAVTESSRGTPNIFWYAYAVPEKKSGSLTHISKTAFNAVYKKTVPVNAFNVQGFRVREVEADETQWNLQYNQYSNRLAWPLCHNLEEFAKEMEDDDVNGNLDANEMMARRIVEDLRNDTETPIWIHDYHHLPLADALRRMGAQNPIMYFHHIPLPTLETLNTRSESEQAHFKKMANALRSCDAALFQTEEVTRRFYDIIGEDAPTSIPAYTGHFIKSRDNGRGKVFIGHAPISINTYKEMKIALTPHLKTEQAKALDNKLVAGNIFINFERCDYSKGIIPRVRAFEEMLKKRPELRGNAQLVLGAEPTRGDIPEYQQYADKVKLMVENLNSNTDLWCEGVPPVIFNNENINHDDVIRLMRNRKEGQRRIGLITPHEDGMNLTAKEFAAAQDPKNAGPLVISSGAGAAAELDCGGKGAIVYPKVKNGDVGALVDAMVRAVYMMQDEADERAVTMQRHLKKYDIQKWAGYHRDIMQRIQDGTFTQPQPAARAAMFHPILAAE